MGKMIRKLFSVLVCMALVASACMPFENLTTKKVYAAESTNTTLEPVKILELQPGTTFDLSGNSQLISSLETQFGREVVVDPVSMVEFVSRVDEVNGKYDIVYVGNNNSAGDYYSDKGSKTGSLPGGATQMSGNTDVEYYSGIDITNLAANKIKEFTRAGQLTIFEGSIFVDSLKNTKLYKNFYSTQADSNFYENEQYPNFVVFQRNSPTATLFEPKNGFDGEYYRNKNFNNDSKHENNGNSNNIHFTWVEPIGYGYTNGNHEISIRWSTSFSVDSSTKYRFSTSFDGHALVKIAETSSVSKDIKNNKVIWNGRFTNIIDSYNTWNGGNKSGEIYLEKDKEYTLLMEYIPDKDDGDDNIFAHLYWQSPETAITNLSNALSKYNESGITKRPLLELTSKPIEYNGTNAIAGANKIMGYTMNISNQNGSSNMTTSLFVDSNGDGIYSEDEKVEYFSGKSGDGYSINHLLPEAYTGLQPWKIEVKDELGAKNYQKGAVAFKGTETEIHVLQLLPNNCTLGLKSLGSSLLTRPGEYKILVDEMNIKDFDDSYKTANPIQLNGKYDMVILGFADIYPGGDLKVQGAIDELKSFIDTNQSVMFTHDTISSMAFADNNWGGKNLTKNFRNLIGQNVFLDQKQPLPESGKPSLGFTRLALDLANGKGIPNSPVAYRLNDTLLSRYPYVLPSEIKVSLTHHQYFQLDLEDPQIVPVFTLKNEKIYDHNSHNVLGQVETRFNHLDGRNDYYTYTKGNITYSGTGHTPPNELSEKQLFINTMIKAARGANHAPSLTIGGISEGQVIANTVSSLDLSILAVDDHDKYMGGAVKLCADFNNNGTYEPSEITTVKTFDINSDDTKLESGDTKNLTISKSVPGSIGQFIVRVEVYDSSNALNTKDITLIQKDEPTLNIITNNIESGYLVGDRIHREISVTANKSTTNYNDTFSGITLTAGIPATDEMTAAGWSSVPGSVGTVSTNLQDVSFNPEPSVVEQRKSVDFTCQGSDGQSIIPLSLQYTNAKGIPKDFSIDITYGVKVGGIAVQVKNGNRGIENATVSVKKDGASLGGTYSSDATGSINIDSLSSGTYEVTLDNTEGYAAAQGTQAVTLNYTNPSKPITFDLTGSPVNNLSFTNGDRGNEDKIYIRNGEVKTGDREAKISYTLLRDIDYGEINLQSTVQGLNITSDCSYNNGILQISEDFCKKGSHEINLKYQVNNSVAVGDYSISLEAFIVREINASLSDPMDSYDQASPRLITFKVSTYPISNVSVADLNGGNDSIVVIEMSGTYVLVNLDVIDPVIIKSLDIKLITRDADNNEIIRDLYSKPVSITRTVDGTTVSVDDPIEPGTDYKIKLYVDGSEEFTPAGLTGTLKLAGITTEEQIDGNVVSIINQVSDIIGILVRVLYELE